ncbi:MAG: ribokinase [Gaiellaceae bacterium]|nr:ribokinase [Gaiellaceae bacterium]
MRIAVVGHVEWVEFARVERVPAPGDIVHALETWQEPAGGGAVAAVQLANLGAETTLFTAFGGDELGERSREELTRHGVRVEAPALAEPTRRAFTFVDDEGERTITVLGDKLPPRGPLEGLGGFEAVYFVSGDVAALRSAREAPLLVAAARDLPTLRAARVEVDVLIGSGTDPAERYVPGDLDPAPPLVVRTAGATGGTLEPGGPYLAVEPQGTIADSYGCGDCFAAAFTFAIARGDSPQAAAQLGARCGAAVLTGAGPYAGQLRV